MARSVFPLHLIAIIAIMLSPLQSFAQAPGGATVPPQMRAEAIALTNICRGDYDRLCAGVLPGGGRALACLQKQSAMLSPPCAGAMSRAAALAGKAATQGVMPK